MDLCILRYLCMYLIVDCEEENGLFSVITYFCYDPIAVGLFLDSFLDHD